MTDLYCFVKIPIIEIKGVSKAVHALLWRALILSWRVYFFLARSKRKRDAAHLPRVKEISGIRLGDWRIGKVVRQRARWLNKAY